MPHTTPTPLQYTEKRLIRLFVMGIFLFLAVFEMIFLWSRYYLEERNQKSIFTANTNRVLTSFLEEKSVLGDAEKQRKSVGVGYIIVDMSGSLLTNRLAGQDTASIQEFLDNNTLSSLPLDRVTTRGQLMMRRVAIGRDAERTILFVAPKLYDEDGLWRDILRLFLMDLVILVPFYYMARVYVQETLEPVKENIDTMNHFVHDAGHELKTPLAIISGNLQILRDTGSRDPAIISESLTTIEDMNSSIEWLLELADLKLPDRSQKVHIKKAVESIIEQFSDSFGSITVRNTISEKITWNMSTRHFAILARNLIENAIKYNHPEGSITITATKKTLSIADTGIGISPEDQGRMFDRFYRAESSRAEFGSGIGLTLVDRIVRLYGWSITVTSEVGQWTTISITL